MCCRSTARGDVVTLRFTVNTVPTSALRPKLLHSLTAVSTDPEGLSTTQTSPCQFLWGGLTQSSPCHFLWGSLYLKRVRWRRQHLQTCSMRSRCQLLIPPVLMDPSVVMYIASGLMPIPP